MALLVQLAGAVMMARAVADPKLAMEIATAVRKHIDANPENHEGWHATSLINPAE